MKTQPIMRRTAVLTPAIGLAGLLAAVLTLPAGPETRYTITEVGTLPGLTQYFLWGGQQLNNRGHIAAYANNTGIAYPLNGDSSFLWTGRPCEVVPLPGLPGATDTVVMWLNDRDQAVGTSGLGAPFNHGALWSQGKVYDLGTLPGDAGTWATAINNRGVIVGLSSDAEYNLIRGVMWHDGKIQELRSLPGAAFTQVQGLNDRGQIVGMSGPHWSSTYHAVLWDHGQIVDLGTLGGDSSVAGSINNRGQIVGQAQTANGEWHAALWANGAVTDLTTFGTDAGGLAACINDRSQIVGFTQDSNGVLHTRLWENNTMKDLQTLISSASGWELQIAASINDRGQIAGQGLFNGQSRIFLLTPSRHQ